MTSFAGFNDDSSSVGWTVGGGVEAAVTTNISLKLEYLYLHFDEGTRLDPVSSVVLGTPVFWDQNNDAHVVRAGVNFKFGGLFGAY